LNNNYGHLGSIIENVGRPLVGLLGRNI